MCYVSVCADEGEEVSLVYARLEVRNIALSIHTQLIYTSDCKMAVYSDSLQV